LQEKHGATFYDSNVLKFVSFPECRVLLRWTGM
jgi:hypothetical protein